MPTISEQIQDSKQQKEAKNPQSQERQEVATRVYSIFEKKRLMRDQAQELFRDRTLKEFIDDNVKRFIQFKRRPEHKKPWQSNLASTTPNEKLIGILSKLATQGMEVKVSTLKELSAVEFVKEKMINGFLKAAAIKNDDDFQIVLEMLEAGEKGTVIGFEDWYHGKRKIREIVNQNPETGDLEFKEKTIKEWNDVRSSLIQLEDFYPGNIYVRPGRIQDMDDCFLRTLMTLDEFQAEFGKFPDANLVQTVDTATLNDSTPFWRQSEDVGNEQVEVLRYFNKRSDEYVILANQVWINAKGKAVVSPLPWGHKKLPFWSAVFEPFDAHFFYGRPLIDKLIAFTDAKDALFDRILDQMTIAVAKPVITDGSAASALSRGFLQPNNVITADWSQGRPKFDVVPIQDPPSVAITMYQMMNENLERTSVSSEVIGGETRKQKTARETEIQREGALEIVSLFLKMMEQGIKEKARLRLANMLQFYSLPSNKSEFKMVKLKEERLSNGKIGMMQIKVVMKPDLNRVRELDLQVPGETEFLEITPKALREFEADVEVVPQSSIKMSETQRQILELNFQRVISELYPDLFNRDAGFEELVKKFGKDPSKMKAQPTQGMPGTPQGGSEGMAQTMAGVGGVPAVRQNAMRQVTDLTTV